MGSRRVFEPNGFLHSGLPMKNSLSRQMAMDVENEWINMLLAQFWQHYGTHSPTHSLTLSLAHSHTLSHTSLTHSHSGRTTVGS